MEMGSVYGRREPAAVPAEGLPSAIRSRVAPILAVVVLLAAAIVYFITLYPAVPFWDAGEFIAVSYILGIPHPPGTPFYVLLGRIATLIPWHTVAERVNALSAVAAALAVMLTYLTTLKLIRLNLGATRLPAQDWIAHVAAATGALMLAFSDSFWENSIEAEVYALMSLAQIFVLWLGLRWWEEHDRRPTSGPLLLGVYVMWLCVGLHLGVGIMGLPLMLLVFLVDRRAALVFAMPFLTVLLVTMGLERMAGGVMALSTLVFIVFAWQKKLAGWLVAGGALACVFGFVAAMGDAPITPALAALSLAGVLVPLVALARRHREGRIIALALFLMVAGYSTHIYLPIRAAQNPAINEGNPSDWNRLRDLLERKQYGQMNMFVRRAPLSVQLDKEFWRYFRRQWPLFPTDRLWGAMLPLLLGVAGAAWQARRGRIPFVYTASFVALTTGGMIVFLNFSPNEVRERDYFFQSGYHAYSIWIGLGVAWLIGWVRDSFHAGGMQRNVTIATAALLACQPLLLARTLWFTHDRRGNYVAEDYAYNMLAPLEPNSFVITNGDNDTFPLWYIQEVEGFRKDVRVVNLSLLNTDWYIRQLRDLEPRIPIRLDDQQVDVLGYGAVRDEAGNIIYTNEFMVGHIMESNREGDGWKKLPYFAVTVPEHMGLDPYFVLEGLVHRVERDTVADDVDVETTRHALYDLFRYRGLFLEDGSWDPSVYKDENASTLSRNYAAAHIQLAYWYRRNGMVNEAIREFERVGRMFPDFTDVLIPLGGFYLDMGDTTKAMNLFTELAAKDPNNPDARYYYGVTLAFKGRVPEAVQEFEAAMRLDPGFSMAYYAAFYTLYEAGDPDRALVYLERWVRVNPNDQQARALLESQRRALGRAPSTTPILPRPPAPGLP